MTADIPNPEINGRERLEAAKQAFRNAVLENDLLFELVKNALEADDIDLKLPEFHLEPWRPASKDENQQQLGLVATKGATSSPDAAPELTVSMRSYQYILVTTVDFGQNAHHLAPELRSLGNSEAALDALKSYMAAYISFFEEVKDLGIGTDSLRGTFALSSELERVAYAPQNPVGKKDEPSPGEEF